MFLQINVMQVVTQQIAENQYSDIKKVSKLHISLFLFQSSWCFQHSSINSFPTLLYWKHAIAYWRYLAKDQVCKARCL